jgi:hypothetical protein
MSASVANAKNYDAEFSAVEYCPASRFLDVMQQLKSEDVFSKTTNKARKAYMEKTYHNFEQWLLKKGREHFDGDGYALVRYLKPRTEHRYYPEKAMSFACLPRVVRNVMLDSLYYDFDGKNTYVSCLVHRCKKLGIEAPVLQSYMEDKGPFHTELKEAFGARLGIDANIADAKCKKFFLSALHGGSFASWAMDQLGLGDKDVSWDDHDNVMALFRLDKASSKSAKKRSATVVEPTPKMRLFLDDVLGVAT